MTMIDREVWDRQLQHYGEVIGCTLGDLNEWTSTLKPDTKFFIDNETPVCLYTDGDSGIASFSAYCECFDDEGMTMNLLSGWCDIPFGTMTEINDNLEEMVKRQNIN